MGAAFVLWFVALGFRTFHYYYIIMVKQRALVLAFLSTVRFFSFFDSWHVKKRALDPVHSDSIGGFMFPRATSPLGCLKSVTVNV